MPARRRAPSLTTAIQACDHLVAQARNGRPLAGSDLHILGAYFGWDHTEFFGRRRTRAFRSVGTSHDRIIEELEDIFDDLEIELATIQRRHHHA